MSDDAEGPPTGPDALERPSTTGSAAAVDRLVELGLTPGQAHVAVTEDRVALALANHALGGDERYSPEEAAEAAGISVDALMARDQALGLPPQSAYGPVDVEDARILGKLLGTIDDQALLRAARDGAHLIRRLAVTHLLLIREQIVEPLRAEGASDLDVAEAVASEAEEMLELASDLVASTYRRIVVHLLDSELVAAGARAGERLDLAIGFADLVDYTSLAARVDPHGLHEVLEAFETTCYEAERAHDGVTLVKFLGDAAMFAALDPVDLASLLLEIVDSPEDESPDSDDDPDSAELSPLVSAGMATGEVLTRGGDYFGDPVNLAARLTDVARAGTLVAADDLQEALDEAFDVSDLRKTRLQGYGKRRPLRIRPNP